MTPSKNNCASCYWWARLDDDPKEFFGICGHYEHHELTNRHETCGDHESNGEKD